MQRITHKVISNAKPKGQFKLIISVLLVILKNYTNIKPSKFIIRYNSYIKTAHTLWNMTTFVLFGLVNMDLNSDKFLYVMSFLIFIFTSVIINFA